MAATAFYAGFAGPDPDYGRRLARLESWGAGGDDEHWRAASPWRQLNLPQIRLEPLLKARAEELSPGRIRFGHELTGLEQDGEGVRASIRDSASGRHYVVRCRYLLGADGGRRVASLAGVGYEGLGVVTQIATLHVSADFSPWAEGSGRADPLDLLAAGRRAGGDGPDGAAAVGPGLGGVGDPPELPGR
jgi:2,4-dichlorophenol 6-monooxygenase